MEPIKEVRVETKVDVEVSVHVSMHVTICGAGKGRQCSMFTHMVKVINTLCSNRMEKVVNVMRSIVHCMYTVGYFCGCTCMLAYLWWSSWNMVSGCHGNIDVILIPE